MAEFRLTIPDETLQAMKDKLPGNVKTTDLARDAFTLLNWAIGEKAQGRQILSSDSDGQKLTRLAMPTLDGIKSSS